MRYFKNKHLSLKQAARIFGYSSDYIGYLIRKRKISGKKVYSTISWQVSKQAIIEYCEKRKRKVKSLNVSSSKHLSLKEAAKISGYSSDYIGFLIRNGKIKGRKIPTQISWLVSGKEIEKYQASKSQKLLSRKNQFPSFVVSLSRDKIFSTNWRLALTTFIIFCFITGFAPIRFLQSSISAVFFEEPKTVNLYNTLSYGNWQNSENVQGMPNVDSTGDINSFSEANSAVYKTGTLVLMSEGFALIGDLETISPDPIEQTETIEEQPSELELLEEPLLPEETLLEQEEITESGTEEFSQEEPIQEEPVEEEQVEEEQVEEEPVDEPSDEQAGLESEEEQPLESEPELELELESEPESEPEEEIQLEQEPEMTQEEPQPEEGGEEPNIQQPNEDSVESPISFLERIKKVVLGSREAGIKRLFNNFTVGAEEVPTSEELNRSQLLSVKIKFSFAIGEKEPDVSITKDNETENNNLAQKEPISFWNKVKKFFGDLFTKRTFMAKAEEIVEIESIPSSDNNEVIETDYIADIPSDIDDNLIDTTDELETSQEVLEEESQTDETVEEEPVEESTETTEEPIQEEPAQEEPVDEPSDEQEGLEGEQEQPLESEPELEQEPEPEPEPEQEQEQPSQETLPNLDTKIIVWWSLDGNNWQILDTISGDSLSNALNNGYFEYDATFLKSWDDIKNLKVQFEGVVGGESNTVAYLDSIWVEANYQKEELEEEFELKVIKKDWRADETPTFEIVSKKEENIIESLIGQISSVFEEEPKVKAKLNNPQNQELELGEEDFRAETHSPTQITIFKPKNFRPGRYSLKITFEKNGKVFEFEQDFTWGVLAINVNKSIYLPNEQVYLQMAVLRDDGHTICDANLRLEVISPNEESFSLDIQRSGECEPNNVTDVPDYFAYYQVEGVGTYQMKLINLDNNYEITDSFEVRESVPFDVERIGPTRIYPPAAYEMVMKIKVNQDFKGRVIESVPDSFVITETSDKKQETWDEEKLIIWDVDWKEGETQELKYQFDAPDITPYLYLLGPLKIGDFQEIRQWQIASDAVTRGATISTYVTSSTVTTVSQPHTVDAGTTLLILVISQEAGETLTVEPYWNTTEAFTLIHATTPSGSNNHVRDYTYGLVNPTAGTYNITYTSSENDNIHHTAVNYIGTTSTSVEDATNYLNEKVNDSATGTTILASGGDSGSTLLVAGVFKGGDGDPASNATGFAELADSATGTSKTADTAFYVADLIGGAPEAITITWALSDENAGQLIEILAAVPITVSGNVLWTDESAWIGDPPCDGSTPNVKIVVDGATAYTTSCAITTGYYEKTDVDAASGKIITIWLNTSGVYVANAVTKSAGANITGLNLYQDRLIVRHETGSFLTNADLAACDKDTGAECADTEDMFFTSDGGTLTLDSGKELHVWTGMVFAPGGDVNAQKLHIKGASAEYSGASETLTLSGSGTGINRPLYIDSGTFTPSNNTTKFTGTAATEIQFTTYNNLTLSPTIAGSITYTGGGAITVGGALDINPTASSTLTLTFQLGGVTAVTGNTTVRGTTSGESILNTNGFDFNESGVLTIGSATNNGTLTAGASSITFSGSDTPFVLTAGKSTFNANTSTVKYTTTTGGSGVDQLPGWDYRKKHTITGSSAGAQSNYQVGIKVYYGSGTDGTETVTGVVFGKVYCNSKCKTDFGDIRFTKSDETSLLDYWIERKTDSDHAIIWVEVESIPESPSTVDIYMYYGNAGASTTSNGPNTFPIFEDNEGSGRYAWTAGYGNTTQSSSYIPPGGGSYARRLYYSSANYYASYAYADPASSTPPIRIRYWFRKEYSSSRSETLVYFGEPNVNYANLNTLPPEMCDGAGAGSSRNDKFAYMDGGFTDTATDMSASTWYFVNIHVSSITSASYYFYSSSWGLLSSATDRTLDGFDTSTTKAYIYAGTGYDGTYYTDAYFDNIYVTNYSSPEPTHTSWGSEDGGALSIITATTYNNLELSPSGAGSPIYTLAATASETLATNGDLTIGDETYAVTVTADTNDPNLNIDGNFTISDNATFIASNTATSTTFAGNWTNSGTFTANGGTVTFDGDSQTFNGPSTTTFYYWDITGSTDRTVTFTAGIDWAVADNGRMNWSGASGQILTIISSSPDTHWNLVVGSSPTFNISYVTVSDSDASTGTEVNASNGTNSAGANHNHNWLFVVAEITISGYARQTNESTAITDASGTVITIEVEGGSTYTPTLNSSGFYEQTEIVIPSAGNAILAYIDGHGTYKGSVVTVANDTETNITDLDIYQDRVIARSDKSATNITNTDFGDVDTVDADDLYSVSSGAITISSSYELHIWAGDIYAPGGDVETGKLHIPSATTYSGDTETLTLSGSGTGTSRPLYVDSGTFTPSNNTTKFTGTAATEIEAETYNNLELAPPGSITLSDPTEDAHITKTNTGETYARSTSATSLRTGPSVGSGGNTWRSYVEWDVSGIPDGSDVTDTVFKFHAQYDRVGRTSGAFAMANRPSTTGSDSAVYADMGDGTQYIAYSSGFFPAASTNKEHDLGTSADSDLEAALSGNWFAIGMRMDDEAYDPVSHKYEYLYSEDADPTPTPTPTLYVEYTYTPTYTLGTAGSQTITTNGNFTVNDGSGTEELIVNWATYDPTLNIGGNLTLNNYTTWTKSDLPATLTLSPTGTKTLTDNNSTKQDIGIISITGGSDTPKIQLETNAKTTTIAIADGHELILNSKDFEITGGSLTTASTGTVTCTSCSAGTVTILGTGNLGGGTAAMTFYNLTLGNGVETATTTAQGSGAVNILNVLNLTTNKTLNAGSKTWTLFGSGTPFIKTGTFTPSSSTVIYSGSSATNVTSTTYNNLELISLIDSSSGMEQVLFGGWYDLLDPTATEYASLVSGYNWTETEQWRTKVVSTDGVIKNFRGRLSDSPGAGKKYTFTLRVNYAPTALTFDIADGATTGSNMVDEIVVSAGDRVSIQSVPDSSPTARYATWTSVFEGDNANESLIMGGGGAGLDPVATEYAQVMGTQASYSGTENDFRQVVPTSGTIKNFYVDLNANPGSDPDAYRFTVRLNGATDADSPIITITAPASEGSDLVNNLSVVAGDVLTMMIEPLNTPSVIFARWGMTFVADVNGESIILGGLRSDLNPAATEYNVLSGWGGPSWTANENEHYQLGQVCTLKKLYILLSAAPGVGSKYDFSLNIAGAGNVVTTVDGTNTTGNSGELTDTVALDEYVDLKVVPDSTPNVADTYLGFVSYIAPVESTTYTLGTDTGQTLNTTGYMEVGDGVNELIVTAETHDPIIDVDDYFTISTDATFVAPGSSYSFTIAGNFTNSGTFTANGGTVTFDGDSQTFNGPSTTTFYYWDITGSTDRTVTFTAGIDWAVADNGRMNWSGASGQILTIISSSPDTHWNLVVGSSPTFNISYVTVSDSDASTGTEVNASNGTNSAGANHNHNWLFAGLEFTIVDSNEDVPPSLELGILDASNNYTRTDWVDLKVTTSATNGYIITAWAVTSYTPDVLRHDIYEDTDYIKNFYGTYATPQTWEATDYCIDNDNYCGFGYTSSDTSVDGSNLYDSGAKYVKFPSESSGYIVSDYDQPVSVPDSGSTYRATVKASVKVSQLFGDYSTTIVFICTAQY